MRLAARKDANQDEIKDTLRAAGVSVFVTSGVGAGFPDLVCGFRGVNFLIEIKDGDKSPSRQKLTTAEFEFHQAWRGRVEIAATVDQALRMVGVI